MENVSFIFPFSLSVSKAIINCFFLLISSVEKSISYKNKEKIDWHFPWRPILLRFQLKWPSEPDRGGVHNMKRNYRCIECMMYLSLIFGMLIFCSMHILWSKIAEQRQVANITVGCIAHNLSIINHVAQLCNFNFFCIASC